jgi:uncharacterized repeat protein (TIGR03847 family)
VELDPVDKLTAGAIGEPGRRTFYLQARSGPELVTVLVEKQQVELLAASILEILATVGAETAEGPGEAELALEDPVEPLFRAGRLSIGYEERRDLMLLEIEELEEEEEEAEEEEGPVELDEAEVSADLERIRLWATREQMLALSKHSAAVAAQGRPKCQFCGNPLDPEGHVCPAMNGHGNAEIR